MYLNGNDFKAATIARTSRKGNIRIAAENRDMAAAADAAMKEWVKTLTPELQKEMLGKRSRRW